MAEPTIVRVADLRSLRSRFAPGMEVWRGGAAEVLTPAEAVEAYREWLWGAIRSRDAAVLSDLRSIADDGVVGCTCPAGACVCGVILRARKWLVEGSGGWPS